jgi:hypothetical protein
MVGMIASATPKIPAPRTAQSAPVRCPAAIKRRRLIYLLLALAPALIGESGSALAVPSFARQTGQPCATCHVGAFGPQLTAYGRQFKLNGYVWNDGSSHVPLAGMLQASLTHTSADQPGGAAPGFGPNDNPAIDQASLFVAGRIFDSVGSFVQITYDGIAKQLTWDNLDVRYVQSGKLFDKPLLLGATVNNNPTITDPWNSTPGWGFPFATSGLAPSPAAATIESADCAREYRPAMKPSPPATLNGVLPRPTLTTV